MSLIRVSAGTTKGYGTKLTLADSNGIQFGYSSHTVTAQIAPVKFLEVGQFESANAVTGSSNAVNLSVQRFVVPAGIAATRLDLLAAYSQAGSTAGSMTLRFGFYTMSGSTASLVSSASAVVSHNSGQTNTTAASVYGGQSGTQWRSYALGTMAFSPGEYLMGVMASIDGPAGSTGSMTAWGRSAISIAGGGALGVANPIDKFDGGMFSAGTSAPPTSLHISNIVRTGAQALAQPGFRLVGTF